MLDQFVYFKGRLTARYERQGEAKSVQGGNFTDKVSKLQLSRAVIENISLLSFDEYDQISQDALKVESGSPISRGRISQATWVYDGQVIQTAIYNVFHLEVAKIQQVVGISGADIGTITVHIAGAINSQDYPEKLQAYTSSNLFNTQGQDRSAAENAAGKGEMSDLERADDLNQGLHETGSISDVDNASFSESLLHALEKEHPNNVEGSSRFNADEPAEWGVGRQGSTNNNSERTSNAQSTHSSGRAHKSTSPNSSEGSAIPNPGGCLTSLASMSGCLLWSILLLLLFTLLAFLYCIFSGDCWGCSQVVPAPAPIPITDTIVIKRTDTIWMPDPRRQRTVINDTTKYDVISGDLEFTLRWKSDDDLDLAVVTPSGDLIWFKDQNLDGGFLDHDMHRSQDEIVSRPIEHITFEDPMPGEYQVFVTKFTDRTSSPTMYSLEVKSHSESRLFTNTIQEEIKPSLSYFRTQLPQLIHIERKLE